MEYINDLYKQLTEVIIFFTQNQARKKPNYNGNLALILSKHKL